MIDRWGCQDISGGWLCQVDGVREIGVASEGTSMHINSINIQSKDYCLCFTKSVYIIHTDWMLLNVGDS